MSTCGKETNGASHAVIYCRVSSEEQVSNTSLATQEKECRAYCQRNGLKVAKVFVEEGESAKTIEGRPALLELIEYCRENRDSIGAVIVWKIDRLSRHTFHYLKIKEEKLAQCQIHSVTEPFQDDAAGELLETMLAGFARFDNRIRADRTKTGMKARLQAGEWTHEAPLGYRRDGNGIEICPDTGPLVKKIFEMYATGMYSQTEILERVTRLGLRTKRGKKLTPQSLNNIVRNPFYAGWLISKALGPKRVKGSFEPLVDQELFDRVQAIRMGKKPQVIPHLKNNPDFPLRAFVSCGACGKPLTAGWARGKGGRYAYYWCYQNGCRSVKEGKMQMEERFCEYLHQLTPNPDSLRLFRKIVNDVWSQKRADEVSGREKSNRRFQELQQKKQRLVDHLLSGTIDESTFKEQAKRLDAEIIAARMQLDGVFKEEYNVEEVVEFGERLVLNAPRLWSRGDPEQRQKLQRLLFPGKITYLNEVFEPTVTCLLYNDLQTNSFQESNVG